LNIIIIDFKSLTMQFDRFSIRIKVILLLVTSVHFPRDESHSGQFSEVQASLHQFFPTSWMTLFGRQLITFMPQPLRIDSALRPLSLASEKNPNSILFLSRCISSIGWACLYRPVLRDSTLDFHSGSMDKTMPVSRWCLLIEKEELLSSNEVAWNF
jgi:hypothetical protein